MNISKQTELFDLMCKIVYMKVILLRDMCFVSGYVYSKTCLKQPLKMDKTKILMINGSLVKVKIIAESFNNTFTCIKR